MDNDTERTLYILSDLPEGSNHVTAAGLIDSSSSDQSDTESYYMVPVPASSLLYNPENMRSQKKHERKHSKKHGKRSIFLLPSPPQAFYMNLEDEKEPRKYFRESRRDSSSSENSGDSHMYRYMANSPKSQLIYQPLGHDGLEDILPPNQQKMRQTQKTAPSQELPSGSLLYRRKGDDYDHYIDGLLFPKQGKEHASYDQGSLYGPLSSRSKDVNTKHSLLPSKQKIRPIIFQEWYPEPLPSRHIVYDVASDSEPDLFPIQRKMRESHKEGTFSGTDPDKNVRNVSAQRTLSQMSQASRMSSENPTGLMRSSSVNASRLEQEEYSTNYDKKLGEIEQYSNSNRRTANIESRLQ
ncbi:hypothetical protein Aperf_G00000132596 [Anoplocephala perfoliata]